MQKDAKKVGGAGLQDSRVWYGMPREPQFLVQNGCDSSALNLNHHSILTKGHFTRTIILQDLYFTAPSHGYHRKQIITPYKRCYASLQLHCMLTVRDAQS